MQQAAPGWFTDPYDPSLERAWDGSAWTNQTRTPPVNASGAAGAMLPESAPNWPRVGVIMSAVALFVIGFAAGYAAHRSDAARVTARASANTPATGSEPANVDVPGPTAPPGVDTAGTVAEQNLGMAANGVSDFLQARPGLPVTVQELQTFDSRFTYDNPGTPIGGPGTVGGPAVISTGIDHLPGAPRRVVLALPGNSACYYVSVSEGSADQYGVARGADAVSHCFVSETAGGVPQVRPETKWTKEWPPPTS